MHELGRLGAQVVCATHSPILASMPRADIIEVGEWGFAGRRGRTSELADNWPRYLETPQAYLRHLIDGPALR